MMLVLVQVLVLVLRCCGAGAGSFWGAAAAEFCHLMLVLAAGRWTAGRAAAGRRGDVGRGYSPGRWRGMAPCIATNATKAVIVLCGSA